MVSIMARFEVVICELSGNITPGDKKCESFYKEFTSSSCRECNVQDKILKLKNPVEIVVDKSLMNLHADRKYILDKLKRIEEEKAKLPELPLHIFKLKGKFVLKLITSVVSKSMLPSDKPRLTIRGCCKGFKPIGTKRGNKEWHVWDARLLQEIGGVHYYEVKVEHSDASFINVLKENLSDDCVVERGTIARRVADSSIE